MDKARQQKARVRRREGRYSVPVFSVRINAELITAERTYHALLWDVSTRGACLQSFEPIPVGISCTLLLHQHAGPGVIERKVHLLWRDTVMQAHYVGLRFDEPIPADSSTFLGALIENSRLSQDNRNANPD